MQPDTDEFLANVVFLFSKKKKKNFIVETWVLSLYFLNSVDLFLRIRWRQILNASLRSIVRKGRILSQLKK